MTTQLQLRIIIIIIIIIIITYLLTLPAVWSDNRPGPDTERLVWTPASGPGIYNISLKVMDHTYKQKPDLSTPSDGFSRKHKDGLVNETNLVHNLFLVYFANFIYNRYMFWTSLVPSSERTTVCMRHLVLVILKQVDSYYESVYLQICKMKNDAYRQAKKY